MLEDSCQLMLLQCQDFLVDRLSSKKDVIIEQDLEFCVPCILHCIGQGQDLDEEYR